VSGHFENLTQVVAAGFNASSAPAMFVSKNHEQGRLLIMKNDDLCQKELVLKMKHLYRLQKCQDFVAYLFEFGYDLAINPDMNISHSPGFESFLCIYGGSGVWVLEHVYSINGISKVFMIVTTFEYHH
jgi:hypothetical protein